MNLTFAVNASLNLSNKKRISLKEKKSLVVFTVFSVLLIALKFYHFPGLESTPNILTQPVSLLENEQCEIKICATNTF